MRGVHDAMPTRALSVMGSSPHARGPPTNGNGEGIFLRIIPACAGSTLDIESIMNALEDHPRMRGVHVGFQVIHQPFVGSSPHARGPPRILPGPGSGTGIIPACAGSTRFPTTEFSED